MATVDIILIICFFPAIVQGITKGFVKQIIGIIAVIAGAWAAFAFSKPVSEWISNLLDKPNPTVVSFASYAAIAIVVIICFVILGNLLSKAIDHLTLGALNRFLGLLFSVIKTALILMLVITLFEQINGSLHLVSGKALQDSMIYETLKALSVKVFPFLKSLVAGFMNV